MDEFAVYKTSLPASQIQAHYNARNAGCSNISGATSSGYTLAAADGGSSVRVKVTATNSAGSAAASSLSVPVVTAAAPTNTSPPTTSGSPVSGQTLSAAAGSWNGGPSYSYQWQRCSGYTAAVNTDTPLGYWRLGDRVGASAADAAGTNTGSYIGSPILGYAGALVSDADTGVYVDGTTQYVALANTVQFDAGNFSVEGWFKTSATPSNQANIWQSGYNGTVNRQVAVALTTAGKLMFYVADAAAASTAQSTNAYNDGAWHHVVLTRSESTLTLYVDGSQVASTSTSLGDVDSATVTPAIGQDDRGASGYANYFPGALDEIAVYTGTLSATRIQAHYNARSAPCSDITGATSSSYTLGSGDVGTSVAVKVTATNTAGATAATSATVSVQASGTPANTGAPAVTAHRRSRAR